MAAKQPKSAQLSLVDDQDLDPGPAEPRKRGRRPTGRHERALNAAVKASPELGKAVSDAAVSLARSMAWALDTAEHKGNAYAIAQLARPYQDVLTALGLVPELAAGGGDGDAFDDFDGPTVGHASHA